MSKGLKTCDICGRDFALIKEEHYVARAIMRNGGITAALTGQDEAEMYDAFDCPHCGCQNIVQVRKIAVGEAEAPDPFEVDGYVEHDGCEGCECEYHEADDEPCADCRGTHKDYYKKRKED